MLFFVCLFLISSIFAHSTSSGSFLLSDSKIFLLHLIAFDFHKLIDQFVVLFTFLILRKVLDLYL